jgi:hypothetical protein
MPAIELNGLPRLAHLWLPVGRTMPGIDILGLATDGKRLLAQVTYKPIHDARDKLGALRAASDATDAHRLFFCQAPAIAQEDGVTVVPVALVEELFRSSAYGERWFDRVVNPATAPRSDAGR